ncbi:MAG: DUF4331 family protein [Alphaproteobacteria bacterium]|nr:DUF4331 family protein [Alphaproteobacteria bacterium]
MWTLALSLAVASDHFDGRAASRDPARDLTDLYAWSDDVAGERRLRIVLDLHPFAGHRSRFSDDITYRVDLRRAEVVGVGAGTRVETGDAFRIDCHLTESRDAMRCRLEPRGPHCPTCVRVLTARLDDPAGAEADGMRMYAGLRRDPFFINTLVVSENRPRRGRTTPRKPLDVTDNALVKASVLSLAFELTPGEVLGGDGLFAVSGRSVWKAHLPDVPRLGRLE